MDINVKPDNLGTSSLSEILFIHCSVYSRVYLRDKIRYPLYICLDLNSWMFCKNINADRCFTISSQFYRGLIYLAFWRTYQLELKALYIMLFTVPCKITHARKLLSIFITRKNVSPVSRTDMFIFAKQGEYVIHYISHFSLTQNKLNYNYCINLNLGKFISLTWLWFSIFILAHLIYTYCYKLIYSNLFEIIKLLLGTEVDIKNRKIKFGKCFFSINIHYGLYINIYNEEQFIISFNLKLSVSRKLIIW